MSKGTIEFQKTKEDTSLPDIVRNSFRIPIDDKENTWVVIHKKRYPVLDICLNGISIDLEKNSPFTVEQALLNCELNIFDVSIKKLKGKIVHLTSSKEGKWRCGVRWIDMGKVTEDKIFKIISKMKDQLLKDESGSS